MIALAFVVAAACGGLTRFATELVLPPVGRSAFPRATLVVNLTGAFLLGLVSQASHDVKLIVGTALCGSLTTFSGVSLQSYRRIAAGSWRGAVYYLTVTLGAGVLLAWLGAEVSSSIFL
jgi:CrcB protein